MLEQDVQTEEWYFFEDDILGAATYHRWQSLSIQELSQERDAIFKRMDGAWGRNENLRKKFLKLLEKFDKYYNHRLELYRQQVEEQRNAQKNQS